VQSSLSQAGPAPPGLCPELGETLSFILLPREHREPSHCTWQQRCSGCHHTAGTGPCPVWGVCVGVRRERGEPPPAQAASPIPPARAASSRIAPRGCCQPSKGRKASRLPPGQPPRLRRLPPRQGCPGTGLGQEQDLPSPGRRWRGPAGRRLGRLQHPSAPTLPLPHLCKPSCETVIKPQVGCPKMLCRSPSPRQARRRPAPSCPHPTRHGLPSREGHPGEGELVPPHACIPRDATGSSEILLDFPMSAIPSSIPGKDGQGGSRAEEI